ncbi:MAG: helix-turn-helix transcriptional regulator [Alphaproteobacteria bacterium]|nr:helix-turn-helix transcriptional regulator [Alphaproteobacteria bacterium]
MTILKEKIIEKMKGKNLSISVLERKAGLSIHTIRNLLKGKIKNPRAEILPAIATVLECSLLELIDSSSSSSNSWQGNIMNKKNKYLEDPIFMAACANTVASLLEEKDLILSFESCLDMIKTLYFYSLPKEPRTPDIKFAKWLLEEAEERVLSSKS